MELTNDVEIGITQSQIDMLNSVTHDYKTPLQNIVKILNKFDEEPEAEKARKLRDLIDLSIITIDPNRSINFRSPNLASIKPRENRLNAVSKKCYVLENETLEELARRATFTSYEEAEEYIKGTISKTEEALPLFVNLLNSHGSKYSDQIYALTQESLYFLRNAWDFFDFSKLSTEDIENKKRETSLIDIFQPIRNIHASSRPEIEEKDITLDVHITPSDLKINTHPIIKKVLFNFVYNAVHYGETYVSVNATQENGNILLVVSDNGTGIDKDKQTKIFEAGFRANETKESTGLGLWMCKDIVTKLGGIIGVDSERAAGSAFYVLLPEGPNQKLTESDFTESIASKVKDYRKELVE